MVKLAGVPLQLFATGVAVIVATTGAIPVLMAVTEGIVLVPVAATPIELLLFVQL